MRLVLSSLILAAGLATAAVAQEQPAAQPAPPPAPPAAQPAPAAAAPAPTAETPPAPAAEAPPPAPTLPTSGDGATAISILEKVCVPTVKGSKFEDVAKANGAKLDRRNQVWNLPFGPDKTYTAVLFPPGSNKGVCTVELHYAAGSADTIAKALNVWAFVHQPPLDPTANYTQPQDPDGKKRVRRSWEYLTAQNSIGLNFSTVRNADDSQINAKYDMGTMTYQERTF